MFNNYLICASLLIATLSVPAAEFYAAPNGLPGANGSLASPWSLQVALAQPASVVRPGDTLWLRGGSYTGPATIWNASLNGSPLAPILVRQFPGERATVNGGMYIGGSWTWYWGFEITNPDPQRNVTNNFARPEGIEIHGRGCKAINLIVHDTGHPGIGFWKQIGDGAEVYGCILWGNGMYDYSSGSRNIRGAGLYGQGETREENRYIKDSIFFRNFTQGIHLYSTGPGVYVNGLHIEGNFFFNNGDAKENLFVGTVAQPCERISILNNCTYFNPGDNGTGIRLGYGALNNTGLEVRDNTVVGGNTSLLLNEWQNVTLTGNSLLGPRQRLVQISQTGGFPTFDYLCNSNTYSSTYANPFLYSDSPGLVSFARWRSDTGYDANSPFTSTPLAQPKVIVRPNQYERGRAHVAVFNWGLQPAVSVDLSTAGLNLGEGYEIRDVQNYFGPPVATGTYNGSPVSLPMNLVNSPVLVGNVDHIVNRHTASDFNAFVVVPLATPPAPNTMPTISQIANRTVNAGSLLAFTASATDSDLPAQTLTFSLDPGAPAGASITSSGLFSWTPIQLQGPGVYPVTVRVTDNGSPSLSDSESFTVTVTNPSTVTNPPPVAGAGLVALQLNGVSAYANVPDSPHVRITGPITVEAWILRSVTGVQHSLVEKYNCNGIGGYALRVTPGNKLLFATLDDCNNFSTVTGTTTLLANTWYHVAATWDGTALRVFVNGLQDSTALPTTRHPGAGNSPLKIGERGDGGTPLKGVIDEVRLWNGARTAADLQGTMNRRLVGNETGLAGYWRFDEGTGSVALDSTSHGNTGMLLNGPVWTASTAPVAGQIAVTNSTPPPPAADFAAGPTQGFAPLTVHFTNLTAGATTSFIWDFGDNTSTNTAQPVKAYTQTGSYSVSLTAIGPGGSATSTRTNFVVVLVVPASDGQALRFDGVNDFVQVPDAPAVRITGRITVEAWIKRDVTGAQHSIVEKYGCNGLGGYALRVTAGDKLLFATLDDCNNFTAVVGATTLTAGTWYHVAGAWDGTALRVFVNGVQDTTALPATRSPKAGTSPLMIGQRGDDGTPFRGMIDDVRLWNVARSSSDILADKDHCLPGQTAGLAGNWRFDEGAGAVATDAPASANHGTLVNNPVWVISTAPTTCQ